MNSQYPQHRNNSLGFNMRSPMHTCYDSMSRRIRILIADDDEQLRQLLQVTLQRAGHHVILAKDGEQALELFSQQKVDLIILDGMMSKMDGFAVCAELRKRSDTPIVMLTALNRPDDVVNGFALGADDYITKPFAFRELEVRLQAIMRRIAWINERPSFRVKMCGDIEMDEDLHEVRVSGRHVHLTNIEYQLLRYLISEKDRPVSKTDLFRNVWGYDVVGGTNLVEVAVRRLREKIEKNPSTPKYLLTVRGAGYKLTSYKADIAPPLRTESSVAMEALRVN